MDHKIEELSECIYDYLASKPNEKKSINRIFNDICGDTGHRCSALKNPTLKKIYKNKFITECVVLNRKFKNVKKYIINNKIYLMYSDKTDYCNDTFDDNYYTNDDIDHYKTYDDNYYDYYGDNETDLLDYNEYAKYLLENKNSKNDFNDFKVELKRLFKIFIKNCNNDLIQKLLNEYDIELDDSIFKIVEEDNNVELLKILLNYEHNKQIDKLNCNFNNKYYKLKLTNKTLISKQAHQNKYVQYLENKIREKNSENNYLVFVFCVLFFVTMWFKFL